MFSFLFLNIFSNPQRELLKEGDHTYLTNWINAMEGEDRLYLETMTDGIKHEYELFKEVPLNGDKDAPLVTVIRYKETKKKTKKGPLKTTKWMWVTDLALLLKT